MQVVRCLWCQGVGRRDRELFGGAAARDEGVSVLSIQNLFTLATAALEPATVFLKEWFPHYGGDVDLRAEEHTLE